MMNVNRIFIVVFALFFVAYGVVFVGWPNTMLHWITGAALDTQAGVIDLRATYGGMSLAVGVLLWWFAQNAHLHLLGLKFIRLLMLMMALGRLIGLIVDGSPNWVMWLYLTLEIIAVMISSYLSKHLAKAS
ncbi:MAG: DUF4345 domain-containing protein [Psychrobium sp.]